MLSPAEFELRWQTQAARLWATTPKSPRIHGSGSSSPHKLAPATRTSPSGLSRA